MPTNRPFTWRQVQADYPEFMAWIRTQTPKNLAGPVDPVEYNQFKTAYGEYLQTQMAAIQSAPDAEPEVEA